MQQAAAPSGREAGGHANRLRCANREGSDKAGDVAPKAERPHGGVERFGRLPSGCSVDPTTGNLAAASDQTPSAGAALEKSEACLSVAQSDRRLDGPCPIYWPRGALNLDNCAILVGQRQKIRRVVL